ncbi:MAG TPA: hypothetical protein VF276_06585 [Chloroflexia bacterium]
MSVDESVALLGQQATALLRAQWGADVVLETPIVLKDATRNRIVRYAVAGAALPGRQSVIVKQITREAARGFTDWAGLAFLTGVPGTAGLSPRFYAGDPAAGFFVMQDMGGSRSLDDVLRGDDPAAVWTGFLALARQTARLHGLTLNREAAFTQARADLPEAGALTRHAEAARWQAGLDGVYDWLAAVDCPAPAGLAACCARIAGVYADPGPFLTFTHGDMAPTNNHLVDGHISLVDFEYGAFRHALYDMTCWQMLCPLPEDLVAAISATYRAALAPYCPAVQDADGYAAAWADLCAYRGLAMLQWIPPGILEANRSWVDDWTMREAVLATVEQLREVSAPFPDRAPLTAAAAALAQTLRRRWPEFTTVLPRWPALRLQGYRM